jgi:hypothetical protein
MNTIDEVLAYYDLTLAECDDDWVQMVEEFRNVKSAMPSHIAIQREKEIADAFLLHHDIKDENQSTAEPEKKTSSGTSGRKGAKAGKPKKPFEFDEKAMIERADKLLEDM